MKQHERSRVACYQNATISCSKGLKPPLLTPAYKDYDSNHKPTSDLKEILSLLWIFAPCAYVGRIDRDK